MSSVELEMKMEDYIKFLKQVAIDGEYLYNKSIKNPIWGQELFNENSYISFDAFCKDYYKLIEKKVPLEYTDIKNHHRFRTKTTTLSFFAPLIITPNGISFYSSSGNTLVVTYKELQEDWYYGDIGDWKECSKDA